MSDTGRPTVMTSETLQKLEHAFAIGCTDLEACVYADICSSTLYNYQREYPEFLERKDLLKQTPVLKARTNVMADIEGGNIDTSKWYLERKKKGEFSSSTNLNLGGQEDGVPISQSLVIEFVGTDDNKTA
jgi:hypothetical protein